MLSGSHKIRGSQHGAVVLDRVDRNMWSVYLVANAARQNRTTYVETGTNIVLCACGPWILLSSRFTG